MPSMDHPGHRHPPVKHFQLGHIISACAERVSFALMPGCDVPLAGGQPSGSGCSVASTRVNNTLPRHAMGVLVHAASTRDAAAAKHQVQPGAASSAQRPTA